MYGLIGAPVLAASTFTSTVPARRAGVHASNAARNRGSFFMGVSGVGDQLSAPSILLSPATARLKLPNSPAPTLSVILSRAKDPSVGSCFPCPLGPSHGSG